MESIADDTVHLVVTSPPYPMIEMWDESFSLLDPAVEEDLEAGDGWGAFERMHRLLDAAWQEAVRVLRPGGILCINIGDATRTIAKQFALYPNHSRIVSSLVALGMSPLPGVLWRKATNSPTKFMGSGMLPGGAYVTLEHEHILISRKGGPRTFTPNEVGRRRASALFWEERNRWFSDLWDLRGVRQALRKEAGRSRSAAFPLEIPFRLVHMYSMEGDLVLDPFGGTGTTAVAAAAGGRNSIMVERDAKLLAAMPDLLLRSGPVIVARARRRLTDHYDFVESLSRDKLAYRNEHLDLPVRTRQERELRLLRPAHVKSSGGAIVAQHEPLRRDEENARLY